MSAVIAWSFLIGVGALILATSGAGAGLAEEPEGKSYFIPALEVPRFVLALNVFNRLFADSDVYDTDGHSFWKNLKSSQVIDTDPFSVNQIGHPYQGSIYYGLARSAGLNYFLGPARFGAVEWRTDDATGR